MNRNTPWRTTRGSRLMALAQGHNDWYRIRNEATGPAQLSIYDEIGFLGVTASDLIAELADIAGPIDVHLNSPGGEVNDGLAIYNFLMARDGVTVYIDGIAASIASVIAMAGDRIKIAPTAQMMIHNAFSMGIGDASDFRAMADRLDENTENIAGIYADRTGKSAAYWREVMAKEGWYRGQEAVDAGLADELTEQRSKRATAASFDMSVFQKTDSGLDPVMADHIRASIRVTGDPALNAAHHPYHSHTEPMHEPMTGFHSHNHAAFECTDGDDGIHAHSHYHAGDAVHGHPHMMHTHDHEHYEHPHQHAHEMGQGETYGAHEHDHAHHDVTGGPGDDDTSRATDHDHDAWAATGTGMGHVGNKVNPYILDVFNKGKYNQADRDRMAGSGEAMSDGSYPIGDSEDLDNAIHAVGRGKNNSHSSIRQHIIKRAKALGLSARIPEDWSSSGSSSGANDLAMAGIYSDADAAKLLGILKG